MVMGQRMSGGLYILCKEHSWQTDTLEMCFVIANDHSFIHNSHKL